MILNGGSGSSHWTTVKTKVLPDQLGDPQITYADNSKGKRILNWSPKISLKEGINKYLEWYKSW